MNTALLVQLASRLTHTEGGDLLLDRTSLQADAVSDGWLALFGNDTVRVSDAKVTYPDANGNLAIAGTTTLLAASGLQVVLTFFLAHDANDPANDAVHCLIVPENFPSSWNIASAYPDMPGYLNFAPDKLAQGRQDSFLKDLQLANTRILYSSYDFFGANVQNQGTSSPRFTTSLSVSPLWSELPRAGVNIEADATLEGDFWDEVKLIQPTLNQLHLFGVITQSRAGLPTLEIGHTFATADGKAPAITLVPSASLVLGLKQLVIRSGLDIGSQVDPGLHLEAFFGEGDAAFDVSMEIAVGGCSAHILGAFADGKTVTLAQMAKILGLGSTNLEAMLPDKLEFFGDLGLLRIETDVSLSPPGLGKLRFWIGTEYPWTVVDELIYLQPFLIFDVSFAGPSPTVSLDLVGTWSLGNTELDMSVSTATGAVAASMAVGQSFDFDRLLEDLFPDAEKPNFVVSDLEFVGNYKEKTFSFEAETSGDWTFDVGGVPITVTDVQLTAEYQDDAFAGRIEGVVGVGGWMAQVDAELGNPSSIEVTLPELPVSDLADEFLSLVRVPVELPNFMLNDFDVKLVPSTGEFSIGGKSTDALTLFNGFAFTMDSFRVQRAADRSQSAALDLTLTLGGQPLLATASYVVSAAEAAGATPPSKAWSFTAALPDTPIPVGHWLYSMQQLAGLSYPLPFDGIDISNLFFAFDLGGGSRALTASAAVQNGASPLAKMSLLAVQPPSASGDAKWDYVTTVDLALHVRLGSLPLVGPQLDSVAAMSLSGMTLSIASRDFTEAEVAALSANLPNDAPHPPATALTKGSNFQVQLALGDGGVTLGVPLDTSSTDEPIPPVAPDPVTKFVPPAGVDHTKWFPVHKSFRAISLERLGVRFQNARVSFLLDAYIDVGPIQMGLLGLGISSPLDHFDATSLAPALDGLSLDYDAGVVQIGGGLLRTPDGAFQGEVRMQSKAFGLAALGRYGTVDGHPSLFMYGSLNAPIGGCPALYVLGLAAGFGYNTRLNLPTIDDVGSFSLVSAVLPGKAPFANPGDPAAVLTEMGTEITASYGSYWLAAGVRFSSFEIVQSFALFTASFGARSEYALLGLSHASVPPLADDPIAYAEFELEAHVDPATGLVAVDGQLTPASYVLSQACQLAGGFGFRSWFSGEHEGDFVVTLGGYGAKFAAPSHYPTPPRLSITWQVSSNMGVKGSSYFALVPHALMAGGALEAVWQSGDLRAWFDMSVDFLLGWKPFVYGASLVLEIGVSYRLNLLFTSVTISVHVGVGIELHGPPFGGEAHVDLSVVSFTVSFGAGPPPPPKLGWTEIKESFLPAQWCALDVTGGLVRDLSTATSTKKAVLGATDTPLRWVVCPERLELTTRSAIPSSTTTFNAQAVDSGGAWTKEVAMRPLGVESSDFTTEHRVVLERLGPSGFENFNGMARAPNIKSVPVALWGKPGDADLGSDPLVAQTLSGFTLTPIVVAPDQTSTVPLAKLQYANGSAPRSFDWNAPAAPTADAFAASVDATGTLHFTDIGGSGVACSDYVLSAIAEPSTSARRAAMVAALGRAGVAVSSALDVAPLATATSLADWPRVVSLGEEAA